MSRAEPIEREVIIPAGDVLLNGILTVPENARAIILFAHGTGSSRFSTRNRFVARHLNESGLATLLFDLLTEDEERVDQITVALRFDIDLLADRLAIATDWIGNQKETRNLKAGYFGASTGAAAALIAASSRSERIFAVVSRGGRPDLANDSLSKVLAPTLLIVGGNDHQVIDLNRKAIMKLSKAVEKRLVIVQGATHLFEEPGTLEEVAVLARTWFLEHLEYGSKKQAV
ncbi:MAG: dienelactone hydrolase family protein [Rubrobacteridae bacterium]|nr:dienelactone hydrolase family protein [Rubrobacteridae bacterium]